jgi:hypothetical protein
MAPLAVAAIDKALTNHLASSFTSLASYNMEVRFPTVLAQGHTRAVAARDDSFA